MYWFLNEEAGLRDEDFYDYTHLYKEDAQERYTSALADRVALVMREAPE